MGTFKDDYYDALQKDYILNANESFIYRFMKDDNNSPRSKNNFKNLLKTHLAAVNNGKESKYDYTLFLVEYIAKNPKIYQDKRNIKSKKLFLSLFKMLSTDERLESIKLNELFTLLKKKKTVDEKLIDSITIEDITNELIEISLHNDIKNFFYDIGYRSKRKSKDDIYQTDKEMIRIEPRKKDKDINMLDAFCKEQGITYGGDDNNSDEDCEKIFEILVSGKNTKVLVPLLSSNTGVSLYIIGKDYFFDSIKQDNRIKSIKKGEKIKKDENSCSYGVFEMDMESQNDDGRPEPCFKLLTGFDDFTDYSGAKSEFKASCKENFGEEYNGSIPLGCPETFKKYFIRSDEDILVEREEARKELYSANDNLTMKERMIRNTNK